jgi:hypothetical protein
MNTGCLSLSSLLSTCSNGGYERIGLVTTLYQEHKFLSFWLSSVRFCLLEETNQQRPGMEGVTDYSIGQYGALSWRADMPEGACPKLHWTTSCVCRSWVRSSRIQGNTIQPCRRNDEQGKWERIATCRNVHQEKHVKLHGLGPNTEKGIVCSPQVKIPLEKSTPRLKDNIKTDLTEVGCKCVAWINLP